MPWSDGLDPALERELRGLYPDLSLRAIGIAVFERARDHPAFADDFEELGVWVWKYDPSRYESGLVLSGASADDPDRLEYPPRTSDADVQARITAAARALAAQPGDRSPTTAHPRATNPRHRPPSPIPKETIKQLMLDLAQRRARPHDRELTQEKIARRLELHPTRVQQAEALERVGWPLLRSHPDFSVNDGFVRWPNPAKAARVLASERTEN